MTRAGRVGLLALALPVALTACGRRGPPVAPERRLPASIQDLSATVVGEGIRLTWSLPKIRVDRSAVKELRRTEVYRRLETGREPPRPAILSFESLFGGAGAVPGFDRVADIRLAEPAPAEVAGGHVTYTDVGPLTPGRRYTYVVVAVDDQGRPSPPSNRVLVAMVVAPRPPSGLTPRVGDREVRLEWTAPTALEDGSPVTGPLVYDVFRGTSPEARPARPLNAEPLASPAYVDIGLQNDATYYYSVRARLGATGPVSRTSEAVAATPEDTTPPAQPRGLVAVVAGAAVRLAWEPVPDADVAGYRIYRTQTTGRGYQVLTAAPQPATTYVDGAVARGQTYYYVVTAVDRSRRANESVPSPEVAIRVP